jgi:hypothetical protein
MKTRFPAIAAAALAAAASVNAAEITISGDISTSQHWVKTNTYYLSGQVYVLAGATLTIDAGTTVIGDNPGGTNPSSLVIARGAKLSCVGTAAEPVIFTSRNDYNTWNGNRLGGTYRKGITSEWGGLLILGRAYIGKYGNTATGSNAPAGNTAAPSANNYANMEGLTAADDRVRFGGGDDSDNSGMLRYTSLRYGGFSLAVGVEVNGLSMGGVGRGTIVDHVDIINNLDDAIETWGGTVDYKYVSCWNTGDDLFDVDQGWRGRLQFALLVAGYSRSGSTGSGMPDKGFEMDGAEYADAQPVGTSSVYNATVIEQPAMNTKMVGLRDNMNVQFRNCIFMDGGAQVLNNDVGDNEAANGGLTASGFGYGYNGTLSYATRWTTAWNTYSTTNPFSGSQGTPASHYVAQSSGKLIEFTDDVFYRNAASNAYTELNARSAFASANNNVQATSMPIVSITREANTSGVTNSSGLAVLVTALDPRPANDALTSVNTAPIDGFFDPAQYRGAMAPGQNWACGWTSAACYGMLVGCPAACPADLNGDRKVDGADLGLVLGAWGTAVGDLNSDGTTDGADLGIVLGNWGNCP